MSPLPVSLLRCVACIVCVRDCPVGGRRCLPRRDDVPKIEIDLSVFRPRFHLLPHSYAQQPALHHALHAAGVSASGVGHRRGPHADHAAARVLATSGLAEGRTDPKYNSGRGHKPHILVDFQGVVASSSLYPVMSEMQAGPWLFLGVDGDAVWHLIDAEIADVGLVP